MTDPTSSLVQTLERKLTVLKELHAELNACREAYVTMNLDKIYGHVATQQVICEKLKALLAEQNADWRALHPQEAIAEPSPDSAELRTFLESLDPALAQRMSRALTNLAIVEADIRHMNHAHSVLVQGTCRTLHIMSNAFAGMAPTYLPPKSAKASGWNGAQS
jgi:hypothetical protein